MGNTIQAWQSSVTHLPRGNGRQKLAPPELAPSLNFMLKVYPLLSGQEWTVSCRQPIPGSVQCQAWRATWSRGLGSMKGPFQPKPVCDSMMTELVMAHSCEALRGKSRNVEHIPGCHCCSSPLLLGHGSPRRGNEARPQQLCSGDMPRNTERDRSRDFGPMSLGFLFGSHSNRNPRERQQGASHTNCLLKGSRKSSVIC